MCTKSKIKNDKCRVTKAKHWQAEQDLRKRCLFIRIANFLPLNSSRVAGSKKHCHLSCGSGTCSLLVFCYIPRVVETERAGERGTSAEAEGVLRPPSPRKPSIDRPLALALYAFWQTLQKALVIRGTIKTIERSPLQMVNFHRTLSKLCAVF